MKITLMAALFAVSSAAAEYAGLTGSVGAGANAKRVKELRITKPGIYENILVDGEWGQHDLVRILADDVVLVHHSLWPADGIEVYARNVRIESATFIIC